MKNKDHVSFIRGAITYADSKYVGLVPFSPDNARSNIDALLDYVRLHFPLSKSPYAFISLIDNSMPQLDPALKTKVLEGITDDPQDNEATQADHAARMRLIAISARIAKRTVDRYRESVPPERLDGLTFAAIAALYKKAPSISASGAKKSYTESANKVVTRAVACYAAGIPVPPGLIASYALVYKELQPYLETEGLTLSEMNELAGQITENLGEPIKKSDIFNHIKALLPIIQVPDEPDPIEIADRAIGVAQIRKILRGENKILKVTLRMLGVKYCAQELLANPDLAKQLGITPEQLTLLDTMVAPDQRDAPVRLTNKHVGQIFETDFRLVSDFIRESEQQIRNHLPGSRRFRK